MCGLDMTRSTWCCFCHFGRAGPGLVINTKAPLIWRWGVPFPFNLQIILKPFPAIHNKVFRCVCVCVCLYFGKKITLSVGHNHLCEILLLSPVLKFL